MTMKFLDKVLLRLAKRIHRAAVEQAREEMTLPDVDPVELDIQKKKLQQILVVPAPGKGATEAVVIHVRKSSMELMRKAGLHPVPFIEKAVVIKLHEVRDAIASETKHVK